MYEKKGDEYELFYRYDTDGRQCLVVKNRISDNYKWYFHVQVEVKLNRKQVVIWKKPICYVNSKKWGESDVRYKV